MHTLPAQIFQTYDVLLYQLIAVLTPVLDAFAYGQTLHHTPSHVVLFDIFPHGADVFTAPHFAVGDVVQRGHYTLHTYLPEHVQRNLVLTAKPPPCLFKHQSSCYEC